MSDTVPVEANTTGPRKVLLVEDNEAAGKGLARLLQAHGLTVTVASDAQSALLELEAGNHPDILLTDVQLPDLDGRELARKARLLRPGLRVVLITGWDLQPREGQAAEWGVECVLLKPVDPRELFRKLDDPPTP